MDRRGFLKTLIGTGVGLYLPRELLTNTYISLPGPRAYANSSSMLAVLKELYSDDLMRDLVCKDNPFLKLHPYPPLKLVSS